MAHSGSVKRSQDILACGLCETNIKIKVKCMDCNLYMCQKCTDKVHPKFKNADLHDIVALKDIHSHIDEVDAKSEFKPVKCKDHIKQLCCMYCITCELLVCPMCIATSHHLHPMEEIQTFCQKKVEEMKKMQNEVSIKTEKCIKNLNLMADIEKSRSNEMEKKMSEEEKLAREVLGQCLRQRKEHKEKTERHVELISNKELEILENEKDIKIVMEEVATVYKLKNTERFLEAVSNLHTKLESHEELTSPKSFNIKIQRFIPNYEIQSSSKSIEIEIQFEKKMANSKLGISGITSITSNKDGNVWITDGRNQIQQLQLKDGIRIVKALEFDQKDFNEIRCLNRDVLFTSIGSTKIYRLSSDDKYKKFKDLSPSKPYTLHVTDNEIIVGMISSLRSIKDSIDIPIIMRLEFNGTITQVYKNHERQLLTRDVVRCCTTITDGAICFIDSSQEEDYAGDVVLINRDGTIQWKYSGNSHINSNNHPFTPVEVLSTKSENILISDMNLHAIHIVTAQGELLTILDLTFMGLKYAGAMTIDCYGTLWTGRDELCSLKFSGF